MKLNHKKTGNFGEEIAARNLEENGYVILNRNFRCRFGEIDIIARDGDTVVFVEVKTRRGRKYGEAEEAVDYRKQRKLRQLAEYYLMKHHLVSQKCRFDVCSVYLDQDNHAAEIKILKSCF